MLARDEMSMRFNYKIDNLESLETAGQSQPMEPGEHICTVIEVREPKPKVIQVWYRDRFCEVNVQSIMVRFARVDNPDQTIVDFFNMPDTLSPADVEAYFEGTSHNGDKHRNFHMRKTVTFIGKLGFPLIGGQLPDHAWDPAQWQGLDVILTAQVGRPRETNATAIMDGVSEQQSQRIDVKPFSYKLTSAGLQRQAQLLCDSRDVPF
jgi:hypothetical protein